VYNLTVVGEDMISDADPRSDMEKQWFISNNNISSNFLVDIIFLNSVTKGGQDD